jgi:fructose 1,6-bisphosphatase
VKAVGMVLNDGQFSRPVYPFDATFWDSVREDAAQEFREFRERQDSFWPGIIESEELEYGGWAEVGDALDDRFEVTAESEPGTAEATDDD